MGIVSIPITKGKAAVDVDTDKIPDDLYQYALFLGLKAIANRGMTDYSTTGLEGEQLAREQAAVMKKATENVEQLYAGKTRKTGGAPKTKGKGKVHTEAMRLARLLVKDQIKALGGKISDYSAKEISEYAEELLADAEQGPPLLAQAEENLAKREEPAAKAIKIKGLTAEAVKSKPSKKKAERPQLSAKQAGQTHQHKPATQ